MIIAEAFNLVYISFGETFEQKIKHETNTKDILKSITREISRKIKDRSKFQLFAMEIT